MSPSASTLGGLQASSTVFLTILLAGGNLGLTLFVIPRLLESPAPLMVRQWYNMLKRTSLAFPIPMLCCAASYWHMAWRCCYSSYFGAGSSSDYYINNIIDNNGDTNNININTTGRLLVTAGALCFSIVPWTQMFVVPINKTFFKKLGVKRFGERREKTNEGEGEIAVTAEEEVKFREMIRMWGVYNLGRCIPVGIAGAIGLYTITLR